MAHGVLGAHTKRHQAESTSRFCLLLLHLLLLLLLPVHSLAYHCSLIAQSLQSMRGDATRDEKEKVTNYFVIRHNKRMSVSAIRTKPNYIAIFFFYTLQLFIQNHHGNHLFRSASLCIVLFFVHTHYTAIDFSSIIDISRNRCWRRATHSTHNTCNEIISEGTHCWTSLAWVLICVSTAVAATKWRWRINFLLHLVNHIKIRRMANEPSISTLRLFFTRRFHIGVQSSRSLQMIRKV